METARLKRRFFKLAGADEVLTRDEFAGLPELAGNPFARRVFELFDEDGDGRITWKEFALAMGQLKNVTSAGSDMKKRLIFRVYDLDGDDLVGLRDLTEMIGTLVGLNCRPTQISTMARQAIAEHDTDGDNALSFREFKALITSNDLQHKFIV